MTESEKKHNRVDFPQNTNAFGGPSLSVLSHKALSITMERTTKIIDDERQSIGECSSDSCGINSKTERRSVSFGELIVTEFPVCLGESDVVSGKNKNED